jgi:putative FmdB family regulatory protein
MPTYQYICEKCGHQFDKFQPISSEALTECPEDACGRKKWGHGKVKRVIGAGAGLIFKGSGFYITDYRSENYKAGSKKEAGGTGGDAKPASAPAAPASGSKTESKSETKTSPPASGGKDK